MTTLVNDSTNSAVLDLDTLPHTYTYNGDGTLATESVTNGVGVWTKTYSYTAGNLTGETEWVRTS